jgi:hypothetical protein
VPIKSGSLLPGNDGAAKLHESVRAELVLVVGKGNAELQAYKQALAGRTAGYVHLANARQLADHALEVDSHFDQGLDSAEQGCGGEQTGRRRAAQCRVDDVLSALR